jgi:hypothetical protein
MTAAHVNKLSTLTRCPVCGDPYNDGLSYTVPDLFARRDFICGAAFVTANARIVVATPCQAGSQVQANLLNHEVEEAGHG